MDIAKLNLAIDKIDMIGNGDWLTSLNDRKMKELDFHNRDRDTSLTANSQDSKEFEAYHGNKKYYSITARSNEYVTNWILKNSPSNVVLDYACGNGKQAMLAAKSGATLALGFDISDISVQNARMDANQQGLKNVRFFQADAENTKLPDACVDRILCSGMLHHLDLSYAFPELRRILKPGGKILATEALDVNPLIKLYRKMTPKMRTDWEKEHILGPKDIVFARRFFDIGEIRYWHVVGYAGGKFPVLKPSLDKLDILLEKTPFVKLLGWMFTFELCSKG